MHVLFIGKKINKLKLLTIKQPLIAQLEFWYHKEGHERQCHERRT